MKSFTLVITISFCLNLYVITNKTNKLKNCVFFQHVFAVVNRLEMVNYRAVS